MWDAHFTLERFHCKIIKTYFLVKVDRKGDCEHNIVHCDESSDESTPPTVVKRNADSADVDDLMPPARAPNPEPPHLERVASAGLTQHPFNADELDSSIIVGKINGYKRFSFQPFFTQDSLFNINKLSSVIKRVLTSLRNTYKGSHIINSG